MKRHLPILLAALVLPFAGVSVSAQDAPIKIAVVDMQEALNKYYKTDIQVKEINDLADEKRKNLDERQAAYQQMMNQMAELDAVYKDVSLAESKRKEALEKLVDEIKKTVDGIVQAQGLDLVFDKSFLPKANKAILYTSANVKDLTADVIAALNAGAPATTSTN